MGEKQKDEFKGLDGWTHPGMSAAEKTAIESDPATHLAMNRGQYLEILHIPSGQSIKFKAYIDDYQDKYDTEWSSTDVFGRMDPIHQYQGTKRVISLDWIVPAYSVAEAKLNHEKCSLLFSMLYPNYSISGARSSATQISTAPVFKVLFGNLIRDPSNTSEFGSVEEIGLVGAIGGFTYSPDIEAGFIDNQGGGRGGYAGGFTGQLYPKQVKLSMEYTVFHTNPLGWDKTDKRTPGFPYGESTSTGGGANPNANAASSMDEQNESAVNNIFGGN